MFFTKNPKEKEKKEDKNKEQEVTFKRFIKISKWVISMLMSIDKKGTITTIVVDILRRLDTLANTYLVGIIFDQITKAIANNNTNIKSLVPYMGILLLYNVFNAILYYIQGINNNRMRLLVNNELERKMYKKLHELGLAKIEEPTMNNIISRSKRSVERMMNYFSQITDLIATAISLVISFGVVSIFAPYLIPLILVCTIPGVLNDKKYRKLMWQYDVDRTEDSRKAYTTAENLASLARMPEILINKAVPYLDKKFKAFVDNDIEKRYAINKKWTGGNNAWNLLNQLSIYIGYLVVFNRAILKQITIGDVFFQTRMLQKLNEDFDQILYLMTNLFEFSIRINDAYVLFQMEPKIKEGAKKIAKLDYGPNLEFKNITFSYPGNDKKILNNLNLTIKSGEKVALVGVNGAGKTTLMKLLCGIYDPTEGSILINGKDLRKIETQSWYDNLGVLLQEYNTYPQLTVKENIIMGNPNIKFSSKRMIEAANNADALTFINEFPNKFEQLLSNNFEGGIRPSTGQWQKIAIARFFYRDAPLVIFDEPTASIDAVSEYNIFNKIYKFFRNKTVIIISHRFSTVRNADRILVLDKGKIIENGTHEELMRLDGKYAHSFNLQAQGYTS